MATSSGTYLVKTKIVLSVLDPTHKPILSACTSLTMGSPPTSSGPLSPDRSMSNEYEDAETNYQPKSLKFWTILAGVYLSMCLVALDRTIIASALPKITDEFNSIEDIGW